MSPHRHARGLAAILAVLAPIAAAHGTAAPATERPPLAPSHLAPPASYIYGPNAVPYWYPMPRPVLPPLLVPEGTQPSPAGWDARPAIGHVLLVVEPVSAEVTLDGVRLTQRADLSYGVGLLEGRHVLRVSASGFEPQERVLDVKRGVGMFFTVRLTASRAEPER